MLKKLSKRMSAMIIALALTLMFVPFAPIRAADDVITIIHTNDMHGRLYEYVNDEANTRLAALKSYKNAKGASFVFDAGDAIQGLPISNITQGDNMLRAMIDVGYDAMTMGNHEFDFGYEQLLDLDAAHGGNIHMLSNNVYKDGTLLLERHVILEKDGYKVGVIGTTTPETAYKTHPKNVKGIEFRNPIVEVKKDVEELDTQGLDLIVVLSHLGNDSETKNNERGDVAAQTLADANYATPILFVDGHAHREFPQGKMYDNVLYVQTGEYLNNIGHVEINKDDFSKSTAKLVAIESIVLGDGDEKFLQIEEDAYYDYTDYAEHVVIKDFPLNLISDRKYARSVELSLGNLIADAILDYGRQDGHHVDMAVMNGGGIRADLNKGDLTIGHILSVIPFGNTYVSIEATGQDILDMLEVSLQGEVSVDDDGNYLYDEQAQNYLIGEFGGFLQVSGARFEYSPFNEKGSKVFSLEILDGDTYKPVELDRKYVLAINDFLAEGGDDFTMLVKDEYIEGDMLEEALIRYLSLSGIDLSQYEEQFPHTRIYQQTFSDATVASINELLEELSDVDETLYTEKTYKAFEAAYAALEAYLDNEMLLEHELLALIDDLDAAYAALEEVEVVVPEEPKPEPTPEPKPETPETDKLPATGSVSLAYPAIALLGVGLIINLISRKKE